MARKKTSFKCLCIACIFCTLVYIVNTSVIPKDADDDALEMYTDQCTQQKSDRSPEDNREPSAALQNEKKKTVYRGNDTIGPGYGALLTCVNGCYLHKYQQTMAADTCLRPPLVCHPDIVLLAQAICGNGPHFLCRYFAVGCHQTHASVTHGTDVDYDE